MTAIIEHHIKPLGLFDLEIQNPTVSRLSAIQGQWTLARFEHIRWILGLFKYAFKPVVFWPVFVTALAVNSYYVQSLLSQAGSLNETMAYHAGSECGKDFSYVVFFYPLVLLILFFHELGHAASAYLFGVKPKNIGFGFYLIFPVFYADVTDVWRLNKWKRTIVNLGGIFFQLLINLGLLYIMYHTPDRRVITLLTYIITLNITTIIINVNPFLKFDGYWVYSDLCNLPNLRQQSNMLLIRLIKKVYPKVPIAFNRNIKNITNLKNPFLVVYSLCKYLFIGYILIALWKMMVIQVNNLGIAFTQLYYLDFSVCAIEFYAKTFLTVGAITYFAYRYKKSYSAVYKRIKSN